MDVTSLFEISRQIVEIVKKNYVQDGMLPTGRLVNFEWNVDFNGELFQLQFYLPKEWKWVELGRRPSDKMPPVSAIEQWITVRKIVPQAKNGRYLQQEALHLQLQRKYRKRDSILQITKASIHLNVLLTKQIH